MSTTDNTAGRGEAVRRETISLLEALAAKSQELELPAPEALGTYRRKLADNTYQILVVGEAKRGKSTFVNALAGHSLLPADVDVATSQVFRVADGERVACRLRFEDDSVREIAPGELSRYGSQAVIDREGLPALNETIRWIEVETPLRFLPPGVSLLDTPGLGALYAAHAQITYRFVPHADAVIFVLDSESPLIETELSFIEMLLGVTRNILFIQTKIDAYGEEVWREIQRRHQEILAERFGERLIDGRVWPVSSRNLLQATQSADEYVEDYLIAARHAELTAALKSFLFRVTGWGRAAEAVMVAARQHTTARQTLAARLTAVTEESKQRRDAMQRQAAERQRQFVADWGEQGRKRHGLRAEITKLLGLGKQGFTQALQAGAEIERSFKERIDAVSSINEANALGESLAAELTAAVSAKWGQVCSVTQSNCLESLRPLLAEVEAPALTAASGAGETPPLGDWKGVQGDWWEKVKRAKGDLITATMLTGVLVFTPLAPLAAIGSLWLCVRGWWKASEAQLQAAQQRLHKHLADSFQQVRRYFFEVDLKAGRESIVDEYFKSLDRLMAERIQEVVRRKSEEAQAEIKRLTDDAALDERQREAKAARLRQQIAEWDGLGQRVTEAIAGLKNCEQPVSAAASGV